MSDLTKITIRTRTPWTPEQLERVSKWTKDGVRFCRTCLADLTRDEAPIVVDVLGDSEPDHFCSWRCAAKHCAAIGAVDDDALDPDFKVKWWRT